MMHERGKTGGYTVFTKAQTISKAMHNFYLFHGCRVALGVIFLLASYDKILHPQAFSVAVFQYQILPGFAVNLVALVLPWLELIIGVCLVLNIWAPGAIVISVILLILFLGSLLFNNLRGLDIHCGCFSTEASEGPAGLWTIARDFVFLGMALYLMYGVFSYGQTCCRARSDHHDLQGSS